MTDLTAYEAALEEAMALLEQGQEMNRARFAELRAEVKPPAAPENSQLPTTLPDEVDIPLFLKFPEQGSLLFEV